MKNKIFLVFMMFIIMVSFSLAQTPIRLLAEEDFQSYENWTDYEDIVKINNFYSDSENTTYGNWSCASGDSACTTRYGTIISQEAGFRIFEEADGNKVLNLYSDLANPTGSAGVNLKYNLNINSEIETGKNYTISFKYKVVDYNWGTLLGNNIKDKYFFGITNDLNIDNLNSYIYSISGNMNIIDATQNGFNNFSKWRTHYDSSISGIGFGAKPFNSECEFITDNNYHNLDYHFLMTENNITSIRVYQDGVFCTESTHNFPYLESETLFDEFYFRNRGEYNINIDDFEVREGLYYSIPPVRELIEDCPIGDCIYYDQFEYSNDNKQLFLDKGYTVNFDNTDLVIFEDSIVYLDGSETQYPAFSYENILNEDYDYSRWFMKVVTNYNTTPASYTTAPPTYIFSLFCDGFSEMFSLQIGVNRDDEFSQTNGSDSVIQLYTLTEKINNLGTYTIPNTNDFVIRLDVDKPKSTVNIQLIADTRVNSFSNSPDFVIPFFDKCENIESVKVLRRDLYSDNGLDKKVGIDYIYGYGIIKEIQDNTPDFEFSDELGTNESVFDGDISEEAFNIATALGFKTKTSKIMFGVIIIFAIILAVITQKDTTPETKFWISILSPIILVPLLWFMGFFPTSMFVFIIFVFAVLGAISLNRLIGGVSS